ncbi:MAG: hypothetical protein JXA74_05780 [Anaerolineae bacterium]|nr:hypothetical protein [Anaerolineae bacterium]
MPLGSSDLSSSTSRRLSRSNCRLPLRRAAPEPGLEERVRRDLRAGRLRLTTHYAEALSPARFCFIAAGTPSDGLPAQSSQWPGPCPHVSTPVPPWP